MGVVDWWSVSFAGVAVRFGARGRFVRTLPMLALVGASLVNGGAYAHGEGGDEVVASQATRTCSTAFEVTIHEGPSAPVLLAGGLTLQIEPSGSFNGTLTRGVANADELEALGVLPARDIPVVGQVNGHAINLLFDLGEGQRVFGAGTAESDLDQCDGDIPGAIGGPAVGPQPGDRGDWAGEPRLTLCVPGFYCVIILW